ncbi:hypothetical protein CYMTET_19917 [Cymbomonas tetramitiformis]|uniref:Uncharacterized protein n=1 Tax=Cymbomonas tetramitiformis TaxID=36881 RepID=A0AAE0G540_9CHLO|nr:hypothetical protein CYMTET_19917 [Cymbomonas tetramitiformis]
MILPMQRVRGVHVETFLEKSVEAPHVVATFRDVLSARPNCAHQCRNAKFSVVDDNRPLGDQLQGILIQATISGQGYPPVLAYLT